MKIIFSNINYNSTSNAAPLQFAAIANFFAQKWGFETIFFGDETSLKNYKNIKYSHFEKIDQNIFKDIPKCFWAAPKLVALYQMNEPCIHLDNDLFLTKPLHRDYLNKDIVCFHEEFWNDKRFQVLELLFNIDPPKECFNIKFNTYNCGIIGGKDITILKKSIKILLDFLIENNEYLDFMDIFYSRRLQQQPNYWFPPVLFEQVWLFQIFKSFDKKIESLVYPKGWVDYFDKVANVTGYQHLMKKKRDIAYASEYINMLKEKNISY